MAYPPSGPFQLAVKKIPLMKVAYRIGLFIRNFIDDDEHITAKTVLDKQDEVFDDFTFTETFEVIMLLFMLSRYQYLEHINRDKGYRTTSKLYDDFPKLAQWRDEYPQYDTLLDQLNCPELFLEILFRRQSWIYNGEFISLDLGHLYIADLDHDIFHPFTNLETLYLNNNLLGTLPPDIFQSLHQLQTVDLSYNLITELPIHLFSDNHKMETIDLTNNGMDQQWLQKFKAMNRLSHGNITIRT